MSVETFQLPETAEAASVRHWRLDQRGLEWTEPGGRDAWMPFACVRRAVLGNVNGQGWRLRLSGPPGAIVLYAGKSPTSADIEAFSKLGRAMLEGTATAGCRVTFALNHKNVPTGWLWARTGKPVASAGELIAGLPGQKTV